MNPWAAFLITAIAVALLWEINPRYGAILAAILALLMYGAWNQQKGKA